MNTPTTDMTKKEAMLILKNAPLLIEIGHRRIKRIFYSKSPLDHLITGVYLTKTEAVSVVVCSNVVLDWGACGNKLRFGPPPEKQRKRRRLRQRCAE